MVVISTMENIREMTIDSLMLRSEGRGDFIEFIYCDFVECFIASASSLFIDYGACSSSVYLM